MEFEGYRAFFGALSNATCLTILQSLAVEPRTIGELARDLNFAQSRVSHAVARLVEAGVVECDRVPHRKLFRMRPQALPLLECIDAFLRQRGHVRFAVMARSNESDWSPVTWASTASGSD